MSSAWLSILLVIAALAVPRPAAAGAPTEQLRGHIDAMITILEDGSLSAAQRDRGARELVQTTFDLSEAARRTLGPRLAALAPGERAEVVDLMKGFFADACMVMLSAYAEQPRRLRDNIHYLDETIAGDEAVVSLTIEPGAELLPVKARLLRRGPRWLIHDLVVHGVSVTENYRAQLERITRR